MKVQCDVCESAEASVMCCADEAALCADCDARVHAANKVAGKHQRVTLLYPGPADVPSCDLCQERSAYFFCLEDRALLCRSCDYSIHSTNALAGKHKRFLVAGVRVALEALMTSTNEGGVESVQGCPSSQIASSTRFLNSSGIAHTQSSSAGRPMAAPMCAPPCLDSEKLLSHQQTDNCETFVASSLDSKLSDPAPMPHMPASAQEVEVVLPSNLASALVNPFNHQVHFNSDWEIHPSIAGVHHHNMNAVGVPASQRGGGGHVRRNSISEYLTETIPGWRVDELLSLTDIMSARTDCGSSKMDTWNYGDAEWQSDYNSVADSIPAQGPAEVPSIPSPPTLSAVPRAIKTCGLGKYPKPSDLDCFLGYDDAPVVPDISGITSSPMHPTSPPPKRRRTIVDF